MRSEQKPIILVSGSTVVSGQTESSPIATRVIPLTGVINRYAEHVGSWWYLAKVSTSHVRVGSTLSLRDRTTSVSVVAVWYPDVTCHCWLCVLAHTVDWPTLARGWRRGLCIEHWTSCLDHKVTPLMLLNSRTYPCFTGTGVLYPLPAKK